MLHIDPSASPTALETCLSCFMLFLCLRQGSGLSDLVGLDFEVNIPTKFSSMFIDTDMFVILNKAKAQFDSITSPCPCERRAISVWRPSNFFSTCSDVLSLGTCRKQLALQRQQIAAGNRHVTAKSDEIPTRWILHRSTSLGCKLLFHSLNLDFHRCICLL